MKKWVVCAAIAVLYIVEIAAMSHVYQYGIQMPGADRRLRFVAAVAAVAQSGALLWLYNIIRKDPRILWPPIAACAIVLTVASFLFIEPQRDAMAYIAYAKETSLAADYSTPRGYVPPPGFEALRKTWPVLPNAIYGPLEIGILRVTVGPTHTLPSAIFVLRLIGIFSLGLLFAAVRRLRPVPSIAAVTIANPFLYFYYVYEPHNDALPIALVMCAMAIAARRRMVAAIFAGMAALVKAPFVFIGCLAFVHERGSRQSIAVPIAVTVSIAVAGSAFGGLAYLRDLAGHSNATYSLAHSFTGEIFSGVHIALAVVALIAIVLAAALQRFNATASFSLSALSSFLYPWYLAWGLPYVWFTAFTGPFLIMLPGLGIIVDAEIGAHLFEIVILCAIVATYRMFIPAQASIRLSPTVAESHYRFG